MRKLALPGVAAAPLLKSEVLLGLSNQSTEKAVRLQRRLGATLLVHR